MASRQLRPGEVQRLLLFRQHLRLFREALSHFPTSEAWSDAYLSFDYERHHHVAAVERYFESVVNFGLGIEQTVLAEDGLPEARDWTGEKLEPELVARGIVTETFKEVLERLRKSRNRVQHAYQLLDAAVMLRVAKDLDTQADAWFAVLADKLVAMDFAVPGWYAGAAGDDQSKGVVA